MKNNLSDHTPITAIELWKQWFNESDDPWIYDTISLDKFCFFCGEDEPNHAPFCVFVAAQELMASLKEI